MVDAVVFDMDGTLLDSTIAVPASYLAVFDQLKPGHGLGPDDIYARYPLGPPPYIFADVLGRAATAHELAAFQSELSKHVADVQPYDGIVEMLAALRADGHPLAVFTGADQASADALMTAAGLHGHFQLVLGTELPIRPKPAPDGLIEVGRRLGVPTTRCAYVGDGPLDIYCANAVGALPIAAEWGHLFDPPHEIESVIAATPHDVVRLLKP